MRAMGLILIGFAGLTAYWIITGRTSSGIPTAPAPPAPGNTNNPAKPVTTPQGNLIPRPGAPF